MLDKNNRLTLEYFNEKVEYLIQCGFVKNYVNRIDVSITKTTFLVESKRPTIEEIHAISPTIRSFISSDNNKKNLYDISLENIKDIYESLSFTPKEKELLSSHIEDNKNIKDLFRDDYKKFNDFLNYEPIYKTRYNNNKLTNEDILYIFIYGDILHSNKDKKKLLDEWASDKILSDMQWNEVVYIFSEVISFVQHIRQLNKLLLPVFER